MTFAVASDGKPPHIILVSAGSSELSAPVLVPRRYRAPSPATENVLFDASGPRKLYGESARALSSSPDEPWRAIPKWLARLGLLSLTCSVVGLIGAVIYPSGWLAMTTGVSLLTAGLCAAAAERAVAKRSVLRQ